MNEQGINKLVFPSDMMKKKEKWKNQRSKEENKTDKLSLKRIFSLQSFLCLLLCKQ